MEIFNQEDEDGVIMATVSIRSRLGKPDPIHPRQFKDNESHMGRLRENGKIYDIEKDIDGLPIKVAGKWKKGALKKTL